jgi:prepilin-type N-terminal cleavage/methylation domain-containing protein
MKTHPDTSRRALAAFTLIELLVVIAVMAILAALFLPAAGALKIRAARTKAKAEMNLVIIAIESYKDKYGHYPPDVPRTSPNWPRVNQLYFELVGTKFLNNEYETLDGSTRIAAGAIPTTFGAGVSGFMNCTRGANADDAPPAKSFFTNLKPTHYGETTSGSGIRLLACSVRWPENHAFQPVPNSDPPGLNPWRYVSSNPTNNPGAFDLWVDILVGGKTNRISNWSSQPQFVNNPL